jgi:hypothetical protein
MPTLKNGMVGVHSTMSSSIRKKSSILAQSQLKKQVGKKTLKNNENNEK